MDRLDLMVFKVGQGLSVAFVEWPENYVILIDLGASTGFTPLKQLRLKYKLRADILYVTHPHADHITDVETALEPDFRPYGIAYQAYDWNDVKKREKPELAYKVDQYQELISLVPRRSYTGKARLKDWCFTPGKAKQFFGEASYVNNSSLFIIYQWRHFKIAVAGDLESDAMAAMVATKDFQRAAEATDILIPAHHGHKNGFPSGWVEKIGKPYVSIISVQERDLNVDSRYSTADFARGVKFNGVTRYALTTRNDGSILVRMSYDKANNPGWEFSSL